MKRTYQSGSAKKRKREKLMSEERGTRTLHEFSMNSSQSEYPSNLVCTSINDENNQMKNESIDNLELV